MTSFFKTIIYVGLVGSICLPSCNYKTINSYKSSKIHREGLTTKRTVRYDQVNHFGYRWTTPMVIVSKKCINVTRRAYSVLMKPNGSALSAVVAGANYCERHNCIGGGYGREPDASGEVTKDALLFDGDTLDAGAVGCLRKIRSAIKVARAVLIYTRHSLLVGDEATEFAVKMGFGEENLSDNSSSTVHTKWKSTNCQPNFWKNVRPDPSKSCGPFVPLTKRSMRNKSFGNFDSIGVIAIDRKRTIVAGLSSTGLRHRIPGRVGTAAIPGAGAFADSDVGAAMTIGDGDKLVKYSPASVTVDLMRRGHSSQTAASRAIRWMYEMDTDLTGAILAVNRYGEFGVACSGFSEPVKYRRKENGTKNLWKKGFGTFPFIVANRYGIRRYWVTCGNKKKYKS